MLSGWIVMETPVTGREKGQSDQAPWKEKVAQENHRPVSHFNGVRKVETRQEKPSEFKKSKA